MEKGDCKKYNKRTEETKLTARKEKKKILRKYFSDHSLKLLTEKKNRKG